MLTVSVISPEEILFEGKTSSVQLPGSDASFSVLAGHTNLIGELEPGMLIIKMDDSDMKYIIDGGFVEVKNDTLSVLVEGAILPDHVDVEAEIKSLGEKISHIIAPEERDFVENETSAHRARIAYAEKK
ncbi:MAG: ATP synthase F1 subunit epsilon [Leptospirales bacterium]